LEQEIRREWDAACKREDFARAAQELAAWSEAAEETSWNEAAQRKVWSVFFPEGLAALGDREEAIAALRRRRRVDIEALNPAPLRDPLRELIFTSNALLTVPAEPGDLSGLPGQIARAAEQAAAERQRFWYDHPIRIGAPLEADEVVYGLRGLNEAIAYEKKRGRARPLGKATALLSVSVTHEGLHAVAEDYLRHMLKRGGPFPHLRVYAFTEAMTRRLAEEVLLPALAGSGWREEAAALGEAFGVDGEYGRHYSFLKAIAALWQTAVDPSARATFKIDLDQVFPQADLEREGGGTAFDHFRSPLWGARGRDAEGTPVSLGMLAGALVNQKDIGRGLFTPDVPWPERIPAGEAVVFFPPLPMALSTRAEMAARYGEDGLDGKRRALHRVHVTGGVNGILIDALRRHRPFTPSFIGRAEDQAYLLSALYEPAPCLRYAHVDGLRMRHDKEAFAGQALEAAKGGRFVGDLVRIVYFSEYARALPWGAEKTKRLIDPFTGAFVSRIPWTVAALRLALGCAARFRNGGEAAQEAEGMLRIAVRRMGPLLRELRADPKAIAKRVERERAGWAAYYRAVDILESWQDKPRGAAVSDALEEILARCRVA